MLAMGAVFHWLVLLIGITDLSYPGINVSSLRGEIGGSGIHKFVSSQQIASRDKPCLGQAAEHALAKEYGTS